MLDTTVLCTITLLLLLSVRSPINRKASLSEEGWTLLPDPTPTEISLDCWGWSERPGEGRARGP